MTTAEKIKALKEERGAKIKEMDAILDKAEKENRGFNPEEKAKYDGLKAEVEGYKERFVALEEKEKRDLETVSTVGIVSSGMTSASNKRGAEGERDQALNKFSWKRALSIGLRQEQLSGAEKELDSIERQHIMDGGGAEMMNGSIMVPADAFKRSRVQKRDMDATTATAAPNNEGSFTIQTNVEGIVDVFLPEMVIGKLPVMTMNNLRGNVQFPQAQTAPSAGYNTENGTATEKSPKLAKLNLSPKRCSAYIQLSNQLLMQSESNIAKYANRFLVSASAIEFEKAALKGGGSNEPSGILSSTSNYVNLFAGDAANNATNAAGARLVWADWVKLVTSPKAVNSPDGQAYVTSPAMKGRAQITPRQSGGVEGNFILNNYNSGINGYPVYGTTNLPDTFSKGGSVVLSAVIFGDWSNLLLCGWGGLEIGVDPYTSMKEAITNVILNSYNDVGVLNPNAFAAIKDAQSY
jgi:HK97 family phage major capsid protein